MAMMKSKRGSAVLLFAAAMTWGWTGSVSAQSRASWTEAVRPFRIAPDIYYVGSKGLAAYLVTSKGGAILLDGTIQENAPLIERNIEAVGIPLSTVKLILIDHAHFDHAGAVAQIQKDTGAAVAASAGDLVALRRGRPRGDYNVPVTSFPPIRVDRVIRDGETVEVGGARLTAHLTQGHTPGCTSWSTTVREGDRRLKVLFLCSITVAGNVLVDNRTYPSIVADYEKTFARLSAAKADIVLTSHPEVADVLGRAARVENGEKDAFIDPNALSSIVAQAKDAFKTELMKAKASARPSSTRP